MFNKDYHWQWFESKFKLNFDTMIFEIITCDGKIEKKVSYPKFATNM